MRKVTITRTETDDVGTFGLLKTDSGFSCYTVELPWRDLDKDGRGDKDKSCIQGGTYKANWAQSPTRKNKDGTPEWTYRLVAVAGREGILIHSANWAGDVEKGYCAQVLGCIGLGASIDDIERKDKPGTKQKGVTSSRDTVARFVADMEQKPFELTVSWGEGVGPKEAA